MTDPLYTVPKLPVPSFSKREYWLAGSLEGAGRKAVCACLRGEVGDGGREGAKDDTELRRMGKGYGAGKPSSRVGGKGELTIIMNNLYHTEMSR